jgi:hypothetical protein
MCVGSPRRALCPPARRCGPNAAVACCAAPHLLRSRPSPLACLRTSRWLAEERCWCPLRRRSNELCVCACVGGSPGAPFFIETILLALFFAARQVPLLDLMFTSFAYRVCHHAPLVFRFLPASLPSMENERNECLEPGPPSRPALGSLRRRRRLSCPLVWSCAFVRRRWFGLGFRGVVSSE